MKRPRTLRSRIVLYFCGYLAVLLTLYSGALIGIFRISEDLIFERQLSEISDRIARHLETHGKIPDCLPMHISAYTDLTRVPSHLQPFVKNREPGILEFSGQAFSAHAAIVPLAAMGQTLFVFYDVGSIESSEQLESLMKLGLMILGSSVLFLGWILARSLSNRILTPVTELVATVRALPLDQDHATLDFDPTPDEVGTLARTISHLLKRISAFTRREREFTSHASHELRTPVSIIKGAMEIISNKIDRADLSLQRPMQRIGRAVTDIEMLIDTFLLLARQGQLPDKNETCSLAVVIEKVVADYRYLLANKPVEVNMRAADAGTLSAPPSIVTIALGNLVRNAFQYTIQGEVEIVALADRVRITDSGPGFDDARARGGLGLTIVKRLCKRMHWQFHILGRPGQGTSAELIFFPNGPGNGRQMGPPVEKTKIQRQDGEKASHQD